MTDTEEVNVETLKSLAAVRGMSQSDVARAAGVSRQIVSHWFGSQTPTLNLFASHLQNLARALGVSIDRLSRPLPILSDPKEKKRWETMLLWDRLYPDLESFCGGVIRGQPAALARLVQVCGLYQSEKVAGQQVWRKFFRYKGLIHPAYRRNAEVVWSLHQNPSSP
ncbi:MAG: helix-turn-helix transcriptional regulator [Deltaproteobacteria bacterium]|nr:helix-turn-helix transcriptional regulator [Deltaproteobacteria bacterium]MBI3295286.1 helix-turn-helix transcriptional regulator [Deltaproteobacteria bacterium]